MKTETNDYQKQIMEELKGLPQERLADLARIVYYYKIGIVAEKHERKKIARLGGFLKGANLGDVEAELKKLHKKSWEHLEGELSNE